MGANRYIKRRLEKKLARFVKSFPAVALSGPRQSGKSTILKKIYSGTHQYVSFDDPMIRQKCFDDPKLFLSGLNDCVIFDEIQYVPQLLSYLKLAIDEDRDKYGRYLLTGSQQFNLIKNLGDTLAGRSGLLTILPFSFFEMASVPGLKNTFAVPEKAFFHSCLRGCFPEIAVRRNTLAADWYSAYLQTYLERDVRGLHNVGNLIEFQKFLQLLATRCAQELNLSNFASDLGVSVNTIKNWLSILAASQIIFLLPPYYRNIGKRIIKNPKVYFIDCGLVAHLTGLKTVENVINGPLAGPLFENFVVSETLKIFTELGQAPRLYYVRVRQGEEIDLLIENGSKLYPFEIKLTKSPRKEMVQSLLKISANSLNVNFANGKLICLVNDSFPLTEKTIASNISDYFNGLYKM